MDKKIFYQWDLNRRLELPGIAVGTEIHFYSPFIEEEEGLKVLAYEENGVVYANVPNILLQFAGSFKVYVWPSHTTHYKKITVIARPKPSDYIYEETEILSVETAVNKAIEKAKERGELDGKDGETPYIKDGNWWIGEVDTGIKAHGPEGKSAYEIAVENGYEGTEQEWLVSISGKEGKSAYDIAVENGYEGTVEEWLDYLAASSNQLQPHKKVVIPRNTNFDGWYTIAETGASRIPRTGLFKVLVKDNSGNWDEIFFVASQCFNSGEVNILSRNRYGSELIQNIGIYNLTGSGVTYLSIWVSAAYHETKNLEIVVLMLESKFDVDGINKWKLVDIQKSPSQTSSNYQRFSLLEIDDWVNEKIIPISHDVSAIEKEITSLKSRISKLENS